MKFISPWLADEKSGMKFLFCEPTWTFLNVSQNIRIIPGVVTYDVGTQTNVNVFLKKQSLSSQKIEDI